MKATLQASGFAIAAAALLLAGALIPAGGATATEPSVTLAVLGETHGTRTITKQLVGHAAAKGATGCVCPGDFIYGDSGATPWGWRDMMRPFMGTMLPAQGNHDWPWSDWQSLFPNGKPYYATDVNGVHFIALNPEQGSLSSGSTQRVWLEKTLAERDPSAMKVVFLHRPWWLPDGAKHPESEFRGKAGTSGATMDALMRQHGVDLVVAGHEKNYQHSERDGVHYLIQGSTGPEWDKYPMSYSLPGAVKRLSTPVGSILRVAPSSLTVESFDKYGGFVESFRMSGSASTTAPAPAPAPAPVSGDVTFHESSGNEWWAQVKLGGAAASSVTKVEAKDANTAWTTLAWRTWGAWAGSFHIEPGNTVTYRATLSDGRVVTSCAYAHPAGTCAAAAPPATSGSAAVTFAPYDGSEWWVQTKLAGADASRVTKVEAMDADTPWSALTWRSWGAWATSFHVAPGNAVTFRATLDDGRVVTSCAYAHPSATCGGGATPAPSGYTAEFRNARGNAWWVEADVSASPLAGVEARVNGGAWTPLAKTSWGSWAKSMSAPAGSSVEFRALSGDGRTATSSSYAWS